MPINDFPHVLLSAQEGAAWAWRVIHDELAGPVTGYVRSIGARDPEDLASEVFLQLARNIETFSGTEENFRSWTFQIAHNRAIDERRYWSRRPVEPTDLVPDRAATNHTEDDALGVIDGHVEAALRELTDEQRSVLMLRILGDLSVEDTAKALGKRPGAVRALQHRALRAIRLAVEPESVTR